jgi:hypothetical protein
MGFAAGARGFLRQDADAADQRDDSRGLQCSRTRPIPAVHPFNGFIVGRERYGAERPCLY